MTRQNALASQSSLPKDENGFTAPVSVSDLIPTSKQTKRVHTGNRNRDWDKAHPTSSYRIPSELHVQASDIRAFIFDLADEKMTSTSVIANAMMKYALGNVREGKLSIQPKPKADRRKLTLMMVEVNEWPRETKNRFAPKTSPKKKVPSLVLTYRWSKENNVQIKALAGNAISEGELAVFLLNFAMDGYNRGRLKFQEVTHTVGQIVGATW